MECLLLETSRIIYSYYITHQLPQAAKGRVADISGLTYNLELYNALTHQILGT